MTLSSTTRRWDYTGTNSTDTYAYTTRILTDDDLTVVETDDGGNETTLTKTTDYTVSGVGDASGGNVVRVDGNLPTDYTWRIEVILPLTQTTDIRNQGSFLPENHEDQFDKFIRIDQQQQEEIDQSVGLYADELTSAFDPKFPENIAGTASSVPVTNAAGDGWALTTSWPSATDISNAQANAAAAAVSAAAAAAAAGTLSPYGINNLGLDTSVGSNALTIALKQADGTTDPSTGDSGVIVYFRSSTLTTGSMTARTATAALNIVVPSTATLGHNNGETEYIYVYGIDNAGTLELAVSSSNHWDEGQTYNTTGIGIASDDAATLYSTTGRTGVAIRLIGRITISEATAGTWASDATRVEPGFLNNDKDIIINKTADFIPKHGFTYKVDTTSAELDANLPTPRAGYEFEFIDDANTYGTNNFILVRNGSENIDAAASNKTFQVNGTRGKVWSDGTDWFTLSSAPQASAVDKTSFTVFTGPTTGSTTVPTSIASPTLSAAEYSAGTAVTRSTNTLTFPFTGIYKITFQFGLLSDTAASSSVGVRLRNTTDNTTSDAAVATQADDDGTHESTQILIADVTDTAKNYEVQWEAAFADVTVTASGSLTEPTPQWRFIIERVGDT